MTLVCGRRSLPVLGLVVATCLAAAPAARSLTNEELRRYGFGSSVTEAVDDMRETQTPRDVFREDRIPAPTLPSMQQDAIPDAPVLQQRVFRQGGAIVTSDREGPTADYRHPKAAEMEGTFKEVENFFFRPKKLYDEVLSMNSKGLTGLFRMTTADIQRKGTTWVRAGIEYTQYDRSFGQELPVNQSIDKLSVPLTYLTVPVDDLELSLQLVAGNEDAFQFPIPTLTSWEVTGLQEVQVMGKYRFFTNEQERISAAVGLGMRIGVEENFLTRIGSNGVDYETFLTVTKAEKNFSLSLEGGLIFPNGENRTHSGVPDITFGGLGLQFRPNGKLELGLELQYLDWNYAGTQVTTAIGAKYRVSRKTVLDLAMPFSNSSELIAGPSYSALASIQIQL